MYSVWKKLKRAALVLLCAGALAFLAGCELKTADSLLSLPRLPAEYVQLQKQLDGILSGGAAYAVAETGTNRQAVQLVDLDGDGVDEALAFFTSGEGTYQVYAFRQEEGTYVSMGMAEGYGATLKAIYYPQCGDGCLGLAMCWGFDENGASGMTVYRFMDHGPVLLLDMQYADAVVEDIDGDGADELAFAVRDNTTGMFSVRAYHMGAGAYRQLFEAPLCLEVKSVQQMRFCPTGEGGVGLYCDSAATTGGYVTDFICYDGKTAVNRTIDQASGSGSKTWRSAAVFCMDLDGDGVLDIPVNHSFDRETTEAEARYRLDWVDFLADESAALAGGSFHVPGESWYFRWPDAWGDTVRVEKLSGARQEQTIFYLPGEGERMVLLTIWSFSAEAREEELSLYRRLSILTGNTNGNYYFSIPDSDNQTPYHLTEDQIRQYFHPIESGWQTEEY